MSFALHELHEIISTVGDIIFMGDNDQKLSIQTGVEFVEDSDCDEQYFEVTSPLKHGMMTIKMWEATGIIYYTLQNASKPFQSINFDDIDVGDRAGSFHIALKAILKADRDNSRNLVPV
jgi:hypothetical protein